MYRHHALFGMVFVLSWLSSIQAAAPAERPNILFAVADDWSYPHAGVYGDRCVRTPTFDRLAKDSVLFTHVFCVSPSCTPSRGAMLSGQTIHRLEDGGNLWGSLPKRIAVYPDLLESAGYVVGLTGKGWGPGDFKPGGWKRNPAGPTFKGFAEFLKTVPADRPFCYWFGSRYPHRPYPEGSGAKSGLKLADVTVPPYLPDTPEVRSDILDYYLAVQRFDEELAQLLTTLAGSGRAANTMLVIIGDNGWPFPRAKANLYDAGTRLPLLVRWPAQIKGGRRLDDFISFTDFAPTFLEAAGLTPPAEMTGKSFLDLLRGQPAQGRDRVYLARERHANVRKGDLSYPVRGVRTRSFLYLRNLRPERWPAGDPETYFAVGPFGDIDPGPAKELLLTRRDDKAIKRFFDLACAKRPAEELYDLATDPYQLTNVAGQPQYAEAQRTLRADLDRWMAETGDPRTRPDDDRWDHYRYFGGPVK